MKELKKILITMLTSLILFILQSAVFPHLSFGQVVPNLIVIAVASFGFMDGIWYGMLAGAFCGFLQDVFFGDVLGLYTMIYLFIGYMNGKLNNIFYPEDIKLPLLSVVVSDLFYGSVCYVLLFLLRGKLSAGFYYSRVIFPELVYTVIVTMVLYPLLLLLHRVIDFGFRRKTGFE